MSNRRADYVFHPPCGSNVPGKVDANPYMNFPPQRLRVLVQTEKDPEKLEKVKSALKQWERQYVFPGYPWKMAAKLRKMAHVLHLAASSDTEGGGMAGNPAINIPYYQDTETPQGYGEIMKSIRNVHDQYNMPREDYNRQGERPVRDIDTGKGDFTSPSEPNFNEGRGVVSPDGEGPDPEGMEIPEPGTGGNMDPGPSLGF